MDRFSIQKSDNQGLLITPAPLWKAFDFMLILACILLLDFEIKSILGDTALFYSKLSFLTHLVMTALREGTWLKNMFCLIPLGLMAAGVLNLGFDFRYFFDGASNRALMTKTFFLIPLEKREIPFESAKEICLVKRKGRKRNYGLILEEGSGKKIAILESDRRENLWFLAKKIQEITNLPIAQKIHS